jgi:hypothetical protein
MHPENTDPLDDTTISALYARTRGPEYTPAVDPATEAHILATARETPRRAWPAYTRWASAAVLVLAIGVAWQGRQQDTAPLGKSEQAPRPGAGAALQADTVKRVAFDAALERDASPAREAASPPPAEARVADDPPLPAAVQAPATGAKAVEEDPRLYAVRALLHEGRTEEARAALLRLRAQHADLVLDAELRALLTERR